MFSLIALEKDISPGMVPDDIMSIIKGTCWASHLHVDQRTNDYTGEVFKMCAGKVLTKEQIDAGIKPCTLQRGTVFVDPKRCLDYMMIGAKKAEYAMSKKLESETKRLQGAGRGGDEPPVPPFWPPSKGKGKKGKDAKGKDAKGKGAGAGAQKGAAAGAAGDDGAAGKKGRGKGDPNDRHCKICLFDGALPPESYGMNNEETIKTNPGWVIHGTAHCAKNPLKGWICTTCFCFGHSPVTCAIPALYLNNGRGEGRGRNYKSWKRGKRRHYWEKPEGEDFAKEYEAQSKSPADYPEPHQCFAA